MTLRSSRPLARMRSLRSLAASGRLSNSYGGTVISDREKIEVASKTYHACASEIEEVFAISTEGWETPRHRFHLTLVKLQSLLGGIKEMSQNRTLDDFSKTELRFAFETVAIDILQKSRHRGRRRWITREGFVRRVTEYLHGKCGLVRVKRLHVRARSGVFPILNKHFKWLLRNYARAIQTDGSSPRAKIHFDGDQWFEG